ncbi:hypothetical protein A8C56_04145 [Niabella ginsenosidivorans]|uniref:Uncharacterized protein n=1 Tax=Niabella ginsenosidivorans TaxID=1176587 RepID=A0A1A9I0N2_9BACT|nr:hypothetical protein A8C56_04145 [Niabella ginsenosidivorans]
MLQSLNIHYVDNSETFVQSSFQSFLTFISSQRTNPFFKRSANIHLFLKVQNLFQRNLFLLGAILKISKKTTGTAASLTKNATTNTIGFTDNYSHPVSITIFIRYLRINRHLQLIIFYANLLLTRMCICFFLSML